MTTIDKLCEVFQDVFEDDELALQSTTTAQDIEDWDSIMHVTLVLATEKAFNIRFSSSEVTRLKNVGDFVDLIESKL